MYKVLFKDFDGQLVLGVTASIWVEPAGEKEKICFDTNDIGVNDSVEWYSIEMDKGTAIDCMRNTLHTGYVDLSEYGNAVWEKLPDEDGGAAYGEDEVHVEDIQQDDSMLC